MRVRGWLFFACAAGQLYGETATEEAAKLYLARRYLEARELLAPLVAKEPANATACYYFGLALCHRGDAAARDAAAPWLEKAVKLDPNNPDFLADYAGNCLELAEQHHSYSLAVCGRDAMEKAIAMNPGELQGRFGLMRFYAQAPWPLASTDRAFDQAGEIARHEPARGLSALIWLGRYYAGKDKRASAIRAFRDALRLDPRNQTALAALEQLR